MFLRPVVLLDVDGVLADLSRKWLKVYNQRYGDDLTYEEITTFDWDRLVVPECGTKIYEMLLEPGFFADDVLPLPGAQRAVERLSQVAQLVAVTSIPRCALQDRRRWLARYFPSLEQMVIAKRKECVWGHVRVDDYAPNLVGAGDYVLMDAPYNQDAVGHVYRVMDWQQAERRIIQLLLDQGWLL